MHYSSIAHVVGILLVVTGSSMVLPVACSFYYGESDLFPLIISTLITLALGLPLWRMNRKSYELEVRDGIFVAVFGWILVSALSGLPFILHGAIPSFTDAFFEMIYWQWIYGLIDYEKSRFSNGVTGIRFSASQNHSNPRVFNPIDINDLLDHGP